MKPYLTATVVSLAISLGSTQALSQDASFIRSQLDKELREVERLQDRWPAIESKYKAVEKTYRNAVREKKKCQAKRWASKFSKPFSDLDAERKKLEEANKVIILANSKANALRRGKLLNLSSLEMSYNGRDKDTAYWDKKIEIVTTISTEYTAVIKDSVIPAYESYEEGITAISEAYVQYSRKCLNTNDVEIFFETLLTTVTDKIDIAGAAANLILSLFPKELRKAG